MFYVKKPAGDIECASGLSLKFVHKYMTYGRNHRRYPRWVRKQCMGVFLCEAPGCKFCAAPFAGQKKGKEALPRPCEKKCPIHKNEVMIHVPCFAGMHIHEDHEGLYCVLLLNKQKDHSPPPQLFGNMPPARKIVSEQKY